MRKPKYHYRTDYQLDGIWMAARYFTNLKKAKAWVARAISRGWEARWERVKV